MSARRVATAFVVAYVVLFITRMGLALSTGSLNDQSGFWFNLLSAILVSLFPLLFLAVGWAIVTRQPGNTIGWLLLTIPLVGMLGFFIGDYATQALKTDPGSLPFGRAAAWFDRWLIVAVLGIFIPLFLLFPDGRVPSRRWRPVLWLVIGSAAVTVVGFATTPGVMTGAFADLQGVRVTNPIGIDALVRRPATRRLLMATTSHTRCSGPARISCLSRGTSRTSSSTGTFPRTRAFSTASHRSPASSPLIGAAPDSLTGSRPATNRLSRS